MNPKLTKLAEMAGFTWPEVMNTTIEERLTRFAALVAADEREACASLIENGELMPLWTKECDKAEIYAIAIRARK